MTKYYLIQNAENLEWYTEQHNHENANSWSPNIQDAFKFGSYNEAEFELTTEMFGVTLFTIVEVILKS